MQMMFALNHDRLVAPVQQPIAAWRCGRGHSFVHRLPGRRTPSVVCTCYVSQVCCPCLVCLTLWAAAVCLTVAGYEDVGQASGSGDFCKGGYGTAVAAAAASAQSKPASSVTGPGVGECRQIQTKKGEKKTKHQPCPSRLILMSPTILLHIWLPVPLPHR